MEKAFKYSKHCFSSIKDIESPISYSPLLIIKGGSELCKAGFLDDIELFKCALELIKDIKDVNQVETVKKMHARLKTSNMDDSYCIGDVISVERLQWILDTAKEIERAEYKVHGITKEELIDSKWKATDAVDNAIDKLKSSIINELRNYDTQYKYLEILKSEMHEIGGNDGVRYSDFDDIADSLESGYSLSDIMCGTDYALGFVNDIDITVCAMHASKDGQNFILEENDEGVGYIPVDKALSNERLQWLANVIKEALEYDVDDIYDEDTEVESILERIKSYTVDTLKERMNELSDWDGIHRIRNILNFD